MSSIRLLSPRESLIDAVMDSLPVECGDYSRYAIVFQGKRPAHFIRKALALRRGKACIPPRIFSLESYIDYCFHELLGLEGGDIVSLDAIGILYEEHCAMRDRIGGDGFVRLEAFFPLGVRMLDAFEELKLHGITPAALKAALPLSDFPSADRLAALYETFYRRIADEGLVSYASKAGMVAEQLRALPSGPFEHTLVAGFFSFTPVEQRVIANLKADENTTFFFQDGPGLKRRIEGIGFDDMKDRPPLEFPEIGYVRAQGTHGEVLGLNRLLLTPGDAPPMDERTVIVLPSADALFPVMDWTLPLVNAGNFNVSLGYPASRTPAFGFLESLVNLLDSREGDQFYVPDYVRFVLHPYTKNILRNGHPEPTRILFHEIENLLAELSGSPFVALTRLESAADLHGRVSNQSKEFDPTFSAEEVAVHLRTLHDVFLRTPMKARTLGAYAETLRDILTYVDDHSAARLHGLFRRFVAAMMESLDALRSSRLGGYHDPEGASYGTLVLRTLEQVNVPFPGTPVQGLQVLGLLETRNLKFDHVIVLDVNDDVLPGTPDVDPLLPVAVRSALKLPLPFDRQEAIDHYFSVLLAGADRVTLFYKEGAAVRRSRFIERFVWSEEKRKNVLNAIDPAIRVSLEVSATNKAPEPLIKTAEDMSILRAMSFSATALDAYLRCPLQFYYAYVLGLRERPDIDPDIDPRGIGTILHEVMRDLDAQRVGGATIEVIDRQEELRGTLDRVFTAHFGATPSIPLTLMKSQMEKQLVRYLRWYGKEVASTGNVRLEGVEVPLAGEFGGVRLTGRADRIELRDGRRVIIDYKKGGKSEWYRVDVDKLDPENPETWQQAMRSVQLPVYLLMAAQGGEDFASVDPVYAFLGSLREDAFEVPLFPDGTDRVQAWSRITATFSKLFREILDPGIPFRPPPDLGDVCPQCAFRAICGTGWVRGQF